MTKENAEKEVVVDEGRRLFLRNSTIAAAGFPLAQIAYAANASAAQQPAQQATAAPAKPRAKSLLVQRRKCTGCNSCTFACSLYHDKVVRPATARIYVRRYYGLVDVPILCWHCPDAPCVKACPVDPKAIEKNRETNVVGYTDEKRCLGASCNKCLEACPPRYLRRHPETAKPIFCDLCDGDPQCVHACNRQERESGEILRSDTQIAGLHWSYRDVSP